MGRAENIFKDWKKKRPVEERVSSVEIVLNEFFPGDWEWKKSSHIIVTSKDLAHHPQFRLGIITVPTVKGRTVKGVYIQNIIKAIDFIIQYKEWKNGKKS